MVEIKQRIVPKHLQSKVTFEGTNQRKTLTVHQTGNTSKGANAEMHARLQERGNPRQASWHIQSDDKEIIQSFPFTAQTWHASDGRGQGNLHSISWEICINSDGNYLKSLEVAAKGIAKVLKDEGLTVADLRQHYDWSQKNCPAQIRAGKDGVNWNDFKAMVQAEMDRKVVKPSSAKPKKSAEQVAQEISKGQGGWGNNPSRAKKLKAEGYDPTWIQNRVNEILKPKPAPKPVAPKPTPKPSGTSYKENGTFYPNDTIIVRDAPSTGANIVARYYKGEKVSYHTVHLKNGYVWLQYNRSNGKQGYIPCRTYSNGKYGTLWGTIK